MVSYEKPQTKNGPKAHFNIDGLVAPPILGVCSRGFNKKPLRRGFSYHYVVAGAGFEPTTYGL